MQKLKKGDKNTLEYFTNKFSTLYLSLKGLYYFCDPTEFADICNEGYMVTTKNGESVVQDWNTTLEYLGYSIWNIVSDSIITEKALL